MRLVIIIFLLASGVVYSGTASACPNRHHDNLICPGDPVVSSNGWVGNVLAINPRNHTAGIRWTINSDGYSVNSRGTYNIDELAIGIGCVAGYCVEDKVVSVNGWEGTIIGVNPYNKKAGVRWHRNSDGYPVNSSGTHDIDDLAIGLGCVAGYCVGDEVVSENGWEGTIIGVNPYNEKAGVRWYRNSDGYSVNSSGTHNIRNLANAKFCEEYGEDYRAVDSNQYIIDRLKVMIVIRGLPNDYWYKGRD